MDKKVLLITGSGRSGTTFLVSALNKMFGANIGPEQKDIFSVYRKLKKLKEKNKFELEHVTQIIAEMHVYKVLYDKYKTAEFNPTDFQALVRSHDPSSVIYAHLSYVGQLLGGKNNLIGLKDPLIIYNLDLITEMFPNFCLIHIYRKGNDVSSSNQKFNWGASNSIAGSIQWRFAVGRFMTRFYPDNINRVLNIKYEECHVNPADWVETIKKFIVEQFGIDFDDDYKELLELKIKPSDNYNRIKFKEIISDCITNKLDLLLGYTNEKKPTWMVIFAYLLSLPYLVLDCLNRVMRKIKKYNFRF